MNRIFITRQWKMGEIASLIVPGSAFLDPTAHGEAQAGTELDSGHGAQTHTLPWYQSV